MTTNKPEIVAWFKPASDATLNSVDAVITDRSMKSRPEVATMGFKEPLVRLSDYERLQAECEKLRKDAERYRWLMERGDDFQWENIIRLDIEDFPSRCAAIDAAIDASMDIRDDTHD